MVLRFPLLAACAASISLLAGCAQTPSAASDAQMIAACAQLDQALIPALWYTGQADQARAGTATVALTQAWQAFATGSGQKLAGTGAGKAGLQDVAGRIARANLAVQMNHELDRAHELLEGARRDLRQLRADAGVAYYPDQVTEFHRVLELMGRAVEDDDRMTLAGLSRRADMIWAGVEATPLDASLYGLSADQADYIAKQVIEERVALERLRAGVQRKTDQAGLRHALAALRGPVVEITLTFGGVHSP